MKLWSVRNREFENQSEQSASEHDRDDVDLVTQHRDECRAAKDESKPIDVSVPGKNNVQSKPNREIQNYTHDRGGDG